MKIQNWVDGGPMSIEVGIWKLGGETPQALEMHGLDREDRLEALLADDLSLLGPKLLLIGRQVQTAFGGRIDLLALDPDGHLVVIELKRDLAPREIVAQLLDYGSWIKDLEDEDIAKIYEDFQRNRLKKQNTESLNEAFKRYFDVSDMPDALNESHELIIVASQLDASTERIVGYLLESYSLSINAVFFRVFKDGNNEYLTRAWLIDPEEAETKSVAASLDKPWNGEYYVSFGDGMGRNWVDAVKYGFIAAGGGLWYSRSLGQLEKGGRIWVMLPGKGYAGVGIVQDTVKRQDEFMIKMEDGSMKPATEVLATVNKSASSDESEYFVAVKWVKTLPATEAVRERGFFGNQNSAARPRKERWLHTIQRLKQRWGIDS